MVRLRQLLDLGISDSEGLVEVHKQRMFNLFMLLATPFVCFALSLNLINGKYELSVFNFIQLAIFIGNIWIGYTRKFLVLRIWSLVLLSIIALYVAIHYRNGTEYRVLVMLVAGVVIFDSNWKYILFALLISVVFSYARYLDLLDQDLNATQIGFRVAQVFFPLLFTCISLYYLKHIYLKSQLKLQEALEDVSNAQNRQQRIMYSLAHDLRSPMSNVISMARLMKSEGNLNEEQIKWLDFIESSTVNSNALINELLESNDLLAKLEKLITVDVNQVVGNMVTLAQLKASEKNIRIQFQPASSACMLAVDTMKIQRLCTNLINNAIKFSYREQQVLVSVSQTDQHCCITVQDFGIGISEKQIPFIFDAFTKAKKKGTDNEPSYGLGLSICKQIAEQHGGDIQVNIALGKGTSFIVSLPKEKSS